VTRDPRAYLEDILASIELIERYTADAAAFETEPMVQDAVARRLGIIGEAVKRLPDSVRTAHPQVAWRPAAGMRDVLIHAYFGLDVELVGGVVRQELPRLKEQVRRILEEG
jgi:uncharacterized protein with HEPN domain